MDRYPDLKGRAFLFLLFLWFLWFLNFTIRTVYSPILPLIEDEFAITHARSSSVFVFQAVGYTVSLLSSGFLSGRFGYKRSILVSLIISSCVLFLVPFVKSFSLLYLLIFIQGLTTGIYIPSVMPIITERYVERVWGKTIAIHDTAASISTFAVPFMVLGILHFLPWRGIFFVLSGSFALAAIAFHFLCDELQMKQGRRAMVASLLRNRTLWLLGVLWIFAAGANLGVYFIVPLYLTKELHLDISYANTIFGISRLGAVAVAISVGFIVDRFSLNKTMLATLWLSGGLTILLALMGTTAIGTILFFQASTVVGFFPASLVAISRFFDREVRGLATGIILTFGVTFGWGIIPYLLGVSGDLLSFKVGILILGVLVILSSGAIFFFRKEEANP